MRNTELRIHSRAPARSSAPLPPKPFPSPSRIQAFTPTSLSLSPRPPAAIGGDHASPTYPGRAHEKPRRYLTDVAV